MSQNDTRLVMTQIDWGTALAAVMAFLQCDPLPSTMNDHQLYFVGKLIAAAQQRLREKSGD